MKTTMPVAILLAVLPLTGVGDSADTDRVVRLSVPVAVTATHEIFGAPLDTRAPVLTLKHVVAHAADYVGREIVITTTVAKVCQKKGCFFIATDGDAVARVTFKDYGFFIPTDSAGKSVLLAGVLQPSDLTTKQAAHAADDLGNASTASVAGIALQIVASAIAIPTS